MAKTQTPRSITPVYHAGRPPGDSSGSVFRVVADRPAVDANGVPDAANDDSVSRMAAPEP
ncbi:MAG: hypothetical protein AMXMBFR56_39870 [Polyangiaceae bacterium]